MQPGRAIPGAEPHLLLVCLVLLCVVGSPCGAIGNAQDTLGPCEPSFVQQQC